MVTNATPEMLVQMKDLWFKNFGDSMDYISFFFEQNLSGRDHFENQYVYLQDGKVVSMLTVLEGKFVNNCEETPFWYVYAVVTDEEYRNKGYAGEVLKHVLYVASVKKILVGLVPAMDSLYLFYRKFGFETFFFQKHINVPLVPKAQSSYCLIEADCFKYKRLRDKAFIGERYVEWNEAYVHYAIKENEELGGKSWIINNTTYFIMVCPIEGTLVVRETNCPIHMVIDICNSLGANWGCNTANIITTLRNERLKGQIKKHGMIYDGRHLFCNGTNEKAYLGLALD